MEEAKYCFIQFKCTYYTLPGEEIRIVGNLPLLGNWDPYCGEKLVTSKLEYPVWKSKENLKVNQDIEIVYKYVIFKNGVFDKWENLQIESNRVLKVKSMLRIIIHDSQNVFVSKIENFTKCPVEYIQKSSKGTNDSFDYEETKIEFREKKIKKFTLGGSLVGSLKRSRLSLLSIKENIQNISIKQEEELQDLNYLPIEEFITETEKTTPVEKELSNSDKVIMCSFYLPYEAVENKLGEWDIQLTSDPFYNNLYKSTTKRKNIIWIGLLKNYEKIKNDNERDTLIAKLSQKYNMLTIKLDKNLFANLKKLIKGILEPLFHYITLSNNVEQIKEFENLWKSYKTFNELVSKTISPHLSENTLIFLNDYHLFLAPTYIYNSTKNFKSKNFKNLSIGLFLHSPFPSHDIYRRFPYREEILKSVMNCSIIGFHSFDYSRNFLTSCRRLLFMDSMSIFKGELALGYYGRKVIIRVKHVSSTPEYITEEINTHSFQELYKQISDKYKNKYIFVSVDNLNFLPGIKNKLEAYKRFLREIGHNYKQNLLLQYIENTEDDTSMNDDYYYNKDAIMDLAFSIKKEFGEDVIQIVEKNLKYAERLAVLASGKCFIKSSKRESFSMDIYDFLNLKLILNDTQEMGYILSELSGVTSSLSASIQINPFDINSIKKGFQSAFQIHFDRQQMSKSQEKDLMHVKKNNAESWMNSFLRELKNSFHQDEETFYLGAGIGLNFRLMKISANFKELDKCKIIKEYENSRRRLILLDYEGTLPSANSQNLEYQSKGLQPCPKIINTLDYLTRDKRNIIFIVTGRDTKLVSDWFSSVNDLGLASEHGFLYRYSSNTKAKHEWEKMLRGFNGDWMGTCIEQLDPYTERCEGSFIEVKEASVVWQYRDCDPDLGKSFATVITADFEKSLKSLKLRVINGKGYVEVKPEGVNKGAFASFILKQEIKKNKSPDFILAVGDDTADEDMFSYLNDKKNILKNYIKNPKVFTITVGKKPSKAESYVDSTSDIRAILESFMQISNRKAMSSSTFDIRRNNFLCETSTNMSNDAKSPNFIEEYNSDYSDY